MKIVVTGSLGHISRPLTNELVQKGHAVTVISSRPERQKDIEALGATAAIGSIEDVDFLTATFTGAEVVYCMIPPAHDLEADRIAQYRKVAGSYAQAIQQAGVKRAIHLSSYGAHLHKGTGIILGAHYAEEILNALPGTAITHMRPAYFYYNLLNYIGMIKAQGVIELNYGGADSIAMVAPADIAAAIAEEIETPAAGNKVRYVASDELTGNEIAAILGAAIGKPDLKWIVISDEQMQRRFEASGMPPQLATSFVEMFSSLHSGALSQDYYRHKPPVMGKVKLADYAKVFAAAFNQK
ncbi:MAG TPA: NAD(P)H-binding protein [Chitinophaga sp.]|uniref:NmrA family NAD(P)-binding protein n=1 Tax=Chitinophaga sp. TaxID=1869181 RepID=UPI002DB9338E|nr:NAD(P)H-binding protein [Chitinophaga sp.]HEU4556145.1 NAD(P)H-binding protein [Chitinophaga sp.]